MQCVLKLRTQSAGRRIERFGSCFARAMKGVAALTLVLVNSTYGFFTRSHEFAGTRLTVLFDTSEPRLGRMKKCCFQRVRGGLHFMRHARHNVLRGLDLVDQKRLQVLYELSLGGTEVLLYFLCCMFRGRDKLLCNGDMSLECRASCMSSCVHSVRLDVLEDPSSCLVGFVGELGLGLCKGVGGVGKAMEGLDCGGHESVMGRAGRVGDLVRRPFKQRRGAMGSFFHSAEDIGGKDSVGTHRSAISSVSEAAQ